MLQVAALLPATLKFMSFHLLLKIQTCTLTVAYRSAPLLWQNCVFLYDIKEPTAFRQKGTDTGGEVDWSPTLAFKSYVYLSEYTSVALLLHSNYRTDLSCQLWPPTPLPLPAPVLQGDPWANTKHHPETRLHNHHNSWESICIQAVVHLLTRALPSSMLNHNLHHHLRHHPHHHHTSLLKTQLILRTKPGHGSKDIYSYLSWFFAPLFHFIICLQ